MPPIKANILQTWKKLAPYGKWTCPDGREVLFNRQYWPILERYSGGPVKAADPNERVPWVLQDYVYNDRDKLNDGTTSERINAVLVEWGVPSLGKPTREAPWKPEPWPLPPRSNPWKAILTDTPYETAVKRQQQRRAHQHAV
jgi:hypothetical protein